MDVTSVFAGVAIMLFSRFDYLVMSFNVAFHRFVLTCVIVVLLVLSLKQYSIFHMRDL